MEAPGRERNIIINQYCGAEVFVELNVRVAELFPHRKRARQGRSLKMKSLSKLYHCG